MPKSLNGKAMNSEDQVTDELQMKRHDLICPISFWCRFFQRSCVAPDLRWCVKDFEGMDSDKYYQSAMSEICPVVEVVQKVENKTRSESPFWHKVGVLTAAGLAGASIGFGTSWIISWLKQNS